MKVYRLELYEGSARMFLGSIDELIAAVTQEIRDTFEYDYQAPLPDELQLLIHEDEMDEEAFKNLGEFEGW